jgi:hypothetical protein
MLRGTGLAAAACQRSMPPRVRLNWQYKAPSATSQANQAKQTAVMRKKCTSNQEPWVPQLCFTSRSSSEYRSGSGDNIKGRANALRNDLTNGKGRTAESSIAFDLPCNRLDLLKLLVPATKVDAKTPIRLFLGLCGRECVLGGTGGLGELFTLQSQVGMASAPADTLQCWLFLWGVLVKRQRRAR